MDTGRVVQKERSKQKRQEGNYECKDGESGIEGGGEGGTKGGREEEVRKRSERKRNEGKEGGTKGIIEGGRTN